MATRIPTPTRIEDVYWAVCQAARADVKLVRAAVLNELQLAGYADPPAVLDAAYNFDLIRYSPSLAEDPDPPHLYFDVDRLGSVPRPAFYDAFQAWQTNVDRNGRPLNRKSDPLENFGQPPAVGPTSSSPWAQRPVSYYPVDGVIGRVMALTVPAIHQRLLTPRPHLQALAQVLACCPPPSFATYEALQDSVCFGQLHDLDNSASGLLVFQFAVAGFVDWHRAWHALLEDENLEAVLLLLYTQPTGRDLTAVVEIPPGMPPRKARSSYAKYWACNKLYTRLFASVRVLDDNQKVYVGVDPQAYLRSDARPEPLTTSPAA